MRRILPFVFALLLLGCAADAPAPEPPKETAAPTPVVTAAPVEEDVIAAASTEPPAPLPTLAPTPEPTKAPTPEPTAEPNPYRGEPVTESQTNPAFWYCPPTAALRNRIVGTSFPVDPKDCPVAMDDLRYVHLLYVDFDGETHEGELLVHRLVADEVMEIFETLFDAGYALRSVRLVDDFGEPFNDERSMAADNTSAFCCRRVSGSKVFSRHSYGAAIDINPVENPYVQKNGSFSPAEGAPYLDRENLRPGMIDENDLCYRLFTERGWNWGGHFDKEKDYQHFSKDLEGVTS